MIMITLRIDLTIPNIASDSVNVQNKSATCRKNHFSEWAGWGFQFQERRILAKTRFCSYGIPSECSFLQVGPHNHVEQNNHQTNEEYKKQYIGS